MSSKISILGASATGIQTAVYLLEQYICEILLYEDGDVEYAQGMALDCMQASNVKNWQGSITVVDNMETLTQADILIVTENNKDILSDSWLDIAKKFSCIIYACKDTKGLADAIDAGISEKNILGVHGLVDAGMLAEDIASELNIAKEDIHIMVYGGIREKSYYTSRFSTY